MPFLFLRFIAVSWIVTRGALGYLFARIRAGRLSPEERARLLGRHLAATLDRLGATFVKLGQVMSTRPDLLGPELAGSLATLQDQVRPFAFRDVERVLEQELGKARARLAKIEPQPVAAASVAQVHRGTLDTGEDVAIKVQRPNAASEIERDLLLLGFFARLFDRIPSVHLMSLPGAVAEFGAALRKQLDFRLEADNNRRFAANFADADGLRVPRVYDELSTSRVLTMEFVNGVRATEPEKVGGDREAIARRGLEAINRMVFKDGFVHADLHPGNIILTDKGEVVLIDLGLVAEIPGDMQRVWVETFFALAARDAATLARLFYGYAPTVGTTDYAAFERDVLDFFDIFYGKALGDLEASEVVGGMMNILRKHHVKVDPIFTVVHLAMLVAEGLGKQLSPSIDIIQLSTPYIAKAIVEAPPGRAPYRVPPVAENETAAAAA